MQWINSNIGTITSALVAGGFFCGMLAHLLPAGKAQNFFAALAHMLPGNVIGALKALSASPPAGGASS